VATRKLLFSLSATCPVQMELLGNRDDKSVSVEHAQGCVPQTLKRPGLEQISWDIKTLS